MTILLDSSVAVHFRDGDRAVRARIAALDDAPFLSMMTRVELDGGIYAKPEFAATRLAAVDAMLNWMPVLEFDHPSADAYRAIVAALGYSRRKVADRMIAATALVHGLAIATTNGDDFRDIPGLQLEEW